MLLGVPNPIRDQVSGKRRGKGRLGKWTHSSSRAPPGVGWGSSVRSALPSFPPHPTPSLTALQAWPPLGWPGASALTGADMGADTGMAPSPASPVEYQPCTYSKCSKVRLCPPVQSASLVWQAYCIWRWRFYKLQLGPDKILPKSLITGKNTSHSNWILWGVSLGISFFSERPSMTKAHKINGGNLHGSISLSLIELVRQVPTGRKAYVSCTFPF